EGARGRSAGPFDGDLRDTEGPIDGAGDRAVGDPVAVDGALERREHDAGGGRGPVGARRVLTGTSLDRLIELGARHDLVPEPAFHGARALDPLLERGEEVGAVAADFSLVDQAGEGSGAGPHGPER